MPKKSLQNEVVTRFPPSPTGNLHIGAARTALFNWLFAKHHDGRVVLRFEDTDVARSDKKYAENIKEGLEWLGIDYDGPYWQSERTDIYKGYIEKLLESGAVYVSDESKSEGDRDEVIRFKNPNKIITFEDMIRGEISVDTTDLGDFVIAKSVDEPLYHLAVVVDDHEMGITNVIRGDEHIANTPRQLLLLEAMEVTPPTYAHIPLILGDDGKKLSKRHGATGLDVYRDMGVLPEGMINYLSLLGWHPSDDQEIFTPKELIAAFTIDRVQKSPATFSKEKLRWVNRQHILEMTEEEFYDEVKGQIPADITKLPQYHLDRVRASLPIFRERIELLSDIVEMAEAGEMEFLFEAPDYGAGDIAWKDDTPEETASYLQKVADLLDAVPADDFATELVKDAVWDYASEIGRGNVLWPTRFALSGQKQSPGPFMIATAIGKEETVSRLQTAISKLKDES
ncbi:MAG: glutamate--tRNA ligase [Candidatus Paceibacterota bacterium]